MSWLRYIDDAGEFGAKALRSFRRNLDDIASGKYDLKKVSRGEEALQENLRNILKKAQGDYTRESTRGEDYLKEMLRRRDRDVREQARVTGLDKMVNEAISEGAPDIVGLDKATRSATLRGQAQELLDTDLGRGRMEINEALRRQNLTIDDLSDTDLRKIIDYLEQRKRMRGM